MHRYFTAPVLLVVFSTGCDSGYVRTEKSQTGGSTAVTVQVDQEKIRRDKEAYRVRAEAKLRDWEKKLDEMQVRAEQASGETKADLQREIEAQKPKLEQARRELHEIDAMAGEKWAEFEARSSKAWDDISAGFERAFSRFK